MGFELLTDVELKIKKRKNINPKERKKKLIKTLLEKVEEESTSELWNPDISDLVMMQMIGDFDGFISSLPESPEIDDPFAEAKELIETTREISTTESLFPRIVTNTIEAQFGNKYATIRELGQNGIDSYELTESEKSVFIDVTPQDDYLVLRARDYGKGMQLNEVVKNLLIPYNSGKEFDPTKIGEHGIGWFSIADITDAIEVVTKPSDRANPIKTIIHNSDSSWKATIDPFSQNGFSPDLNNASIGTEVRGYVPSDNFTAKEFRDQVTHFLGYVDSAEAKIYFQGEIINSLRNDYVVGTASEFELNGTSASIAMGLSKRRFDKESTDERYSIRDKKLDEIVVTQNGLFVQFMRNPFKPESVHNTLLAGMLDAGLDLWVDLPSEVTLTKGRNGIISGDREVAVDGIREAFENLYLDVVLSDPEFVNRQSGFVMKGISSLFMSSKAAKSITKNTLPSIPKRLYFNVAKYVAKIANLPSYFFKGSDYGMGSFTPSLPVKNSNSPETLDNTLNDTVAIEEKKKNIVTLVKYSALASPVAVGAAYFGYKLLTMIPGVAFQLGAYGLGAVAASGAAILAKRSIQKIPFRQASENFRDRAEVFSEEVSSFYNYMCRTNLKDTDAYKNFRENFPGLTDILNYPIERPLVGLGRMIAHKVGLYKNMEERRDLKRAARNESFSREYIEKLKEDSFLQQIMGKRIIPVKKHEFKELIGKPSQEWGAYFEKHGKPKYKNQNNGRWVVTNQRISVAELVNLYLDRNIVFKQGNRTLSYLGTLTHGDCTADVNNPLVRALHHNLSSIGDKAKEKYNPTLLEDHLSTIGARINSLNTFGRNIFGLAYLASGVGTAHIVGAQIAKKDHPFSDTLIVRETPKFVWRCASFPFRFTAKHLSNLNDVCNEPSYNQPGSEKNLVVKRSKPASYLHTAKVVASKSLSSVVIPTLSVLNPLKYFGYASKTLSFTNKTLGYICKLASEELEYAKHSMSNTWTNLTELKKIKYIDPERYENRMNEARSESVTEYLASLTASSVFQQISTIMEFLGLGNTHSKPFDLSVPELSSVVKRSNMGVGYLRLIRIAESVDSIMAEALGEDPFEYDFSYGTYQKVKKRAMFIDEESKIHISADATKYNFELMNLLSKRIFDGSPTNDVESSFDYALLDSLIHQRAHQNFDPDQLHEKGDSHTISFYNRKSNIRRKVVDYLVSNNIDLTSHIDSLIPNSDYEYPREWYAPPAHEFSIAVHAPKWKKGDLRLYVSGKVSEVKERAEEARQTRERARKEANALSRFMF